jgi:hypothetical protein
VVQVEQENVLPLREPDQLAAEERAARQVEGHRRFGFADLLGLELAFSRPLVADIDALELEVQGVENQLPRPALLAGEHGAQSLVPGNDLIEGLI